MIFIRVYSPLQLIFHTYVEAIISSVERQQKILTATVELLANAGMSGVTHRAVDKGAGLPEGSTSYHFPKKQLLLEAAADHLAELLETSCTSVKARFAELIAKGARTEAIDFVAKDLLKFADEERALQLARFELALASTRSDHLLEAADRLARAAREPIKFFLQLLSDEVPESQVETCMGLLDGLAMLHATGQGPKPTVEQIKKIFLSV